MGTMRVISKPEFGLGAGLGFELKVSGPVARRFQGFGDGRLTSSICFCNFVTPQKRTFVCGFVCVVMLQRRYSPHGANGF